MSTHAAHLQPPPAAVQEVSTPDGERRPHPPTPPDGHPRPVTFYSIEIDTPARDFWECLARLLSLLGALARRRTCGR